MIEETANITEIAPDGTETTIEITTEKPDDASFSTGDESHGIGEVIDALFDNQTDDANAAHEFGGVPETGANHFGSDDVWSVEPSDGDFNVPAQDSAPFAAAAEVDSTASGFGGASSNNAADDGNLAAHADAAFDAQQAADGFVASGDYAAAAEARETAENEAYAAGDGSMLHGSDSIDIGNSAYAQQNAEYYEQQEATHAASGDYEAAREDAGNAAYATSNADWYASGADHSAQANAEHASMDNAVWEQGTADYYASSADSYAAQGDFDNAAAYADTAAAHQDSADNYGATGEHGGDFAVHDASSDVASGSSYEAPAVDYSSHDSSTE